MIKHIILPFESHSSPFIPREAIPKPKNRLFIFTLFFNYFQFSFQQLPTLFSFLSSALICVLTTTTASPRAFSSTFPSASIFLTSFDSILNLISLSPSLAWLDTLAVLSPVGRKSKLNHPHIVLPTFDKNYSAKEPP
ncbi:uncharacterized protein VTP21DRAFT_5677 [Calcarisporiella thermophila]|uniref:uncharacterized protein n=1 Tax=Calcarisporiella thermophila TaxID=911321 RepID=UPI003744190E